MKVRGPSKGAQAQNHIVTELGFPMETLLSFPKYVFIETVNTCNARCVMCPIDFSKPKAFMADSLFGKIVDELAQYKDHVEKTMLFLDCEPLIDKDLPEKIRRLKSAGIKIVHLSSNGSLLTEKKGRELIEAGLDQIYLNVDSLKKDVFERIRKRLIFEEVYENIVNFIRLRDKLNPHLQIRIQIIVQEENYTEVPEWIAHWENRLSKNDQIVAIKAHNWGSQIEVMQFNDYKPNEYPCPSLWGTFTVHQNGIVSLCCVDTHTKVPLGDLNQESIAEVWQRSPQLNQVREDHLSDQRNKIPICDGCSTWRKTRKQVEILVEKD